MSKLTNSTLGALFAVGMLFAQGSAATPAGASDCASQAVSKDGKPLAGAAKASFLKKCEADAKGSK